MAVLVKIQCQYLSWTKVGYIVEAFFNSTYLVYALISLIPRPSHCPVFDHLHYSGKACYVQLAWTLHPDQPCW